MLRWLPFTCYLILNCCLLIHYWRCLRQPRQFQSVTIAAAFIYISAVLALCLTPTHLNIPATHKILFYLHGVPYNAIPFQGISPEFLLNIVMTVPWGIFLYLFGDWQWQNAWLVAAACFLFSLFIEANQFCWDWAISLGRLADVDDLITNTIGGITGFLIMLWLDQTPIHRLIKQFRLKMDKSLVH